jgi:hypothetical protein
LANQYFSVKEQVFDIQFTNRSLVHELQNRVSRITNDRLIREMNSSLEKIVPENLIIKFDSITLDIGDVDYNSLEDELVPKIIQSLEEQLELQIRLLRENKYAASEGSISVENIAGSEELLEYFLMNGVLPWWAQMNNGFSLDEIIRELAAQNPSGLRALITRIGQNEYARKRMVFQFGEDSIQKIIQVLEPSESAYILGYHKEVVSIQQKEQLVQAETTTFAKAVWLFIVTYLLEDRGSDFNRKAFVKSTLVQMAAWFNVSYYELIKLFYEAVTISVEHDQHIISLETFIRELTIEEEIYHEAQLPEINYAQPESVPSKNAEQLSRKADLLMYYLLYGSLPPGANGYSNESLAEMLHELVIHIPETMRGLLAVMTQDANNAKRYFELTGYQRGKELLQKLYPRNARLLITLSSLVELIQAKKQLLGADITGLEQTLPRMVIQILFSTNENGDDFSLLDQYIKQLSAEFRKDGQQLIQDIHAAVQEEFRQGIRNSNLPALIGRLAEQSASLVKEDMAASKETAADNVIAAEDKGLKDTLVYLVQYGHIPWWGKRFFEKETTDELFDRLFQSAPNDLLQLLRVAGSELRLQKRLLSFVSVPTLFDSMVLLPGGEKAASVIQQAIYWFEQGIGVIGGVDSAIRKIMFHAAWDEMITNGYQSFSAAGFYSRTVLRLAAHLATTAGMVVNTFAKGLAMDNDTLLHQAEKEILDTITQLLDGKMVSDDSANQKKKKSKSPDKNIDLVSADPFIQKLLARLPDNESDQVLTILSADRGPWPALTTQQLIQRSSVMVKHEAVKEAREILRYFLVWKRLPDDIRISDYQSIDRFIKQVVLLVYSIDQDALLSLVKDERYIQSAAYAFARMFDANKGWDEKQVSNLVDTLLTGKKTSVEAIADSLNEQDSETRKQETAVKEWLCTTIDPAQKITTELLSAEAVKTLEYFFVWKRLPDQWKELAGLSLNIILKQLLMILYKENRMVFQRLLQDQTHLLSARVFFHELVSVAEGGIEKEAALFIQPYKELYQQKQLDLIKPAAVIQIEKESGEDYSNTKRAGSAIMSVAQLATLIDGFLSGVKPGKLSDERIDTDEKLIKTVIQLYSLDQQALKQVLAKDDHLVSARIRLHDVFITQTGYQERAVLQLLQQYRQTDLLALLASKEVDPEKPGDLARVLSHFLGSDKRTKKESELWQMAISSPLFIRYLTIDAEPQVLKTFIRQTAIGWGEEVVDYMQALRRLLEAAVPNNLERDKLLSLLLQFNLLFLSGRLLIKTRSEYLQAFFAFIMQATHSIPVTVFIGILQFVQQDKISATSILAGSKDILQTELRELINRLDQRLLQKQEWQRQEDAAEMALREENEHKRLQQLEAIRAELEKERLLEEERRKKESEKSEDEKRNKIYIRNAGMVLLHPFLGIYFSRLGLTEQGKFVDESSQQRAVLLLQYLVNGRNVSEEFELALNKILCGLDIGAAVPLEIELTEAEIAMSAEMFQVIFQRWEKMKNTSVEGFRASFLQREGALTRGQENWELRVEQRTYDMLLDTLPWSFSMIKNTWMNQLLTVEWM